MKLIADYHLHTYYSDGRCSVEEIARAAFEAGLLEIAITDHGPGHFLNGVRKKDKLYAEVMRAREDYAGRMDILFGVEANLMALDGCIDVEEKDWKLYDIILMGYHKTAVSLRSMLHFHGAARLPFCKQRTIELTTRAYCAALERYPIDIVVHPNYGARVDVAQLAAVAAKTGAALEINGNRNFMSLKEMEAAKAAGAVFAINSDAHTTKRIGDTARAVRDAELAGIDARLVVNTREGPLLNCKKGDRAWNC
ncbi:MAG: PHP domain-containing protein [Christensenellales bacterium]|jgi:putative hydrolase